MTTSTPTTSHLVSLEQTAALLIQNTQVTLPARVGGAIATALVAWLAVHIGGQLSPQRDMSYVLAIICVVGAIDFFLPRIPWWSSTGAAICFTSVWSLWTELPNKTPDAEEFLRTFVEKRSSSLLAKLAELDLPKPTAEGILALHTEQTAEFLICLFGLLHCFLCFLGLLLVVVGLNSARHRREIEVASLRTAAAFALQESPAGPPQPSAGAGNDHVPDTKASSTPPATTVALRRDWPAITAGIVMVALGGWATHHVVAVVGSNWGWLLLLICLFGLSALLTSFTCARCASSVDAMLWNREACCERCSQQHSIRWI